MHIGFRLREQLWLQQHACQVEALQRVLLHHKHRL